MREIKFRAWDEQNNVMHNDFQFIKSGDSGNDWIIFKSNKHECFDRWVNNPYFSQQLKIMQYTGLKDKNGKEIYADSDIFKFKYLEELHKPVELIGSFTFNEDDLRYEIDIYNHDRYIVLNYAGTELFYDFEIIGTIQENPELLK